MFAVKYKGDFGFIKPWDAVRNDKIASQQFLTPSMVTGMEIMLFGEANGAIKRHRIKFDILTPQQETVQGRGFFVKNKMNQKETGIATRYTMLNPELSLLFETKEEAEVAFNSHLFLARNEDIIFPIHIEEITEEEFDLQYEGFELVKGDTIVVGYNRYTGDKMTGNLEYFERTT
ncbi:hypothetical protein MY04_05985 (plasmid) [Flammeovirga sp. MY04]|uniref:hypothetical protein n=1 Tax=Flammeovirga sp. MY04 TaxID=1191459 RepID=UPI000806404C|nr:hypothetical protein [Flammeovirga sp. MY04]ANQ52930.1 hypothetical protein MY04_05985 [Flammeovirga sp. MY04]